MVPMVRDNGCIFRFCLSRRDSASEHAVSIRERRYDGAETKRNAMTAQGRIRRDTKAVNPEAMHLELDTGLFSSGDRVCVAVSGGADSMALLRTLLARRAELGIVLSVVHVEHGLRGEASARDAAFVAETAKQFELSFEMVRVDTQARVIEHKESVEQAARYLRYAAFRSLLAEGKADKVATAHTLNDQAETVLMKLLRGAWTEGLSGIHPVISLAELPAQTANIHRDRHADGQWVIRPLLAVSREEIEAYLTRLGQSWCEDETNQSLEHTRNRVRHDLLPILRIYNRQVEYALACIAANARAEERHWQAEMARVLPQLVRPGKPVRGGGRAVSTEPGHIVLGVELARLWELDEGLRRRVLRAVAEQCGATLNFAATERLVLLAMAGAGHRTGLRDGFPANARREVRFASRLELTGGVQVERTARELQFQARPRKSRSAEPPKSGLRLGGDLPAAAIPAYELVVPGSAEAPAFQARFFALLDHPKTTENVFSVEQRDWPAACIRVWRPGDRVTLRHSSGPRKVKEVLERVGIRGEERKLWPVIEWQGRIVWMRGVELAAPEGIPSSRNGQFVRFTETRTDL